MTRASVEMTLARLGIEAKRRGDRWWSERCPLPTHTRHNAAHSWKNFFVRVDGGKAPGLWHCYSCKEGGQLVELVMAMLGLEWSAALAWLREVEEAPAPAPVVSVRYDVSAFRRFTLPAGVEFPPFAEWNSVPLAYARRRGLDAEQVARWRVGVAFEGRLKFRIVFPIFDWRGQLSNYAARTFVEDETRYLAADEREHPDKSVMLGESGWPSAERRAVSTLIVFEGALTGMAIDRSLRRLELEDRVFVAGLQGSDVTHRRIAKFATFGRVVAGTDPDAAGDDAAEAIRAGLSRKSIGFVRAAYPRPGVDAADLVDEELDQVVARVVSPAGRAA